MHCEAASVDAPSDNDHSKGRGGGSRSRTATPHSLIADNLLALRHVLNMTAIIRCGVRVARYN
jgi:hypothetical protein